VLTDNGLHCRSGGGFAQLIQTTTNAWLCTTVEDLFFSHHFGNAVVVCRLFHQTIINYKKIKQCQRLKITTD
jgi:hypothetical protein